MKRSKLNILFYLRKNRVNKSGKVSLMIRLTVEHNKIPITPFLEVNPELWDDERKKMIGKTQEAITINNKMEEISVRLRKIHDKLNETGVSTPNKIKAIFTKKDKVATTIIQYYLDRMTPLLGLQQAGQRSQDLIDKHTRTYSRLRAYIKDKYKIEDLDISEIDTDFIVGYQNHLMIKHKCSVNTTAKYIQNLRSVILSAFKKKLIKIDPFEDYALKAEKVDRGYLTEDELLIIAQKKFASERLERVRDIFIFSCFTGLAYIDVKSLTSQDIQTSFDGKSWIIKDREKTGIKSRIPLLPIPQRIIEKYSNMSHDKLLPILSNQKMNEYLKEIAVVCNIQKHLTFHLSRHTFATTVTLAKGVTLESVSKMLGHSNIVTTQIYAKITDPKISNEMKGLTEEFSTIESGILGKLKSIEIRNDSYDNIAMRNIAVSGINMAKQLLSNKMALLDEISEQDFAKALVVNGFQTLYFSDELKIAVGKNEVIIGTKKFGEIMGGYFFLKDASKDDSAEMIYGTVKLNRLSPIQHLPERSKIKQH